MPSPDGNDDTTGAAGDDLQHLLDQVDGGDSPLIGPIARRRFLQASGVAGLVVAAGCVPDPGAPPASYAPPEPPAGIRPTHSTIVRRREDLLRLRFDFYNLVPTGSGDRRRLVRTAANAWIVVRFPPQHQLEETLPAEPPTPPPPFGDLDTRLSGGSRLSFHIPPALTELPYTTEALLGWVDWRPVLPLGARPVRGEYTTPLFGGLFSARPPIQAPTDTQTAIELPWWLLIAPNRFARFANSTSPVTRNGRTELWHTRLAIQPPAGDPTPTEDPENVLRTGRAVWTRDPALNTYLSSVSNIPGENTTTEGQPFGKDSAMLIRDRVDLVKVTSGFQIWNAQPFDLETLALSPLGGFITAQGGWEPTNAVGTSLESWRLRATMGRDHFVRIVRRGFLFPWGHPTVRIDISERKFLSFGGRPAAYLEKRSFLVIRTPLKQYGGFAHEFGGRRLPFRSVRATTLVTPPLTFPDFAQLTGENAKLPTRGGVPYEFTFVGRDHTGRAIEFTSPAVFVEDQGDGSTDPNAAGFAYQSGEMGKVRDRWNSIGATDPLWGIRLRPMGGQRIAYAPELQPDDTRLETRTITFRADPPSGGSPPALKAAGQPAFFPGLAFADVRLPELEQAAGEGLAPPSAVLYESTYLQQGINGPNNRAGVFVRFADDVPLGFSADRSGAVLTPAVQLRGISAKLGPVGGDLATLGNGSFDPSAFFDLDNARFLGGVSLAAITKPAALPSGTGAAPPTALQFRTREVDDGDAVETRLEWRPELQDDQPLRVFDSNGATLELVGLLRTHRTDPSKSSSTIQGDLRNFRLNMVGQGPLSFMRLDFRRVSFNAGSGEKASMDIDLRDVEFLGALRWVKTLTDYLDFGGSGFEVNVGTTSIEAGLTIALPHIEIGVVAMQNARFSAVLDLPLNGDPARVRFAFSSRHDPFRVTIMMFGGGGWVGLALGVDGVELLELGFEAGAEASVNLGIASGRIGVFCGFMFQIGKQGGTDIVRFVGYVRMRGEVSGFGFSVTVEMNLSLEYLGKPAKNLDIVTGRATVTLTVEVFWVSKSVTFRAEKSFGGNPADPTFAEQMPAKELWSDYCDAFASTGA